jgi:hypothetical protein
MSENPQTSSDHGPQAGGSKSSGDDAPLPMRGFDHLSPGAEALDSMLAHRREGAAALPEQKRAFAAESGELGDDRVRCPPRRHFISTTPGRRQPITTSARSHRHVANARAAATRRWRLNPHTIQGVVSLERRRDRQDIAKMTPPITG